MMESIYIAGMRLEELVSMFSCDIKDDDFYDVLAYNIMLKDQNYLIKNISQYEGRRLRGTIFGLSFYSGSSQTIIELLDKYLNKGDFQIIAEVIKTYSRMNYIEGWEKTKKLLNHESPYVRSSMLRYANTCLSKDEAKDILVEKLRDTHYIVRESAIDELESLQSSDAIEYIVPLLNDENEDVKEAAKSAIDTLKSMG